MLDVAKIGVVFVVRLLKPLDFLIPLNPFLLILYSKCFWAKNNIGQEYHYLVNNTMLNQDCRIISHCYFIIFPHIVKSLSTFIFKYCQIIKLHEAST